MNSSLCYGWVSHRRLMPRYHGFRYRSAMLYLDLDEQQLLLGLSPLLGATRLAPLSWRETDYLPAWTRRGIPLKDAVREVVAKALGQAPCGPIHLLTQPRSWGISFNPVSFYFCHDSDGLLAAIVLEVRNTPWRERFHYVLSVLPGQPRQFSVSKQFHVSPFLPMDMQYHMRFHIDGAHVRIHMENHREEQKVFEADLALQRKPLDAAALRRHVLAFPWMSLRTLSAIYWQAMCLLLKRTPLFAHTTRQSSQDLGHDFHEEPEHVRSNSERQ
ncbi:MULTISPECIES: DUF1365 domain-containing protein [unclassified Pseudomonas]|uniref:DUF1365 domain-containing protein n=1 Tax=unclassified Pseudomonas TaxID=196821 RepID=UPI0007030026|nr:MULTISPECIES: DUF1365 domain-containing protein [unclassified Pseudomonas]KQZ91555.1 hypothetical protein ASD60_24480 [Pseudomonas sp. Root562]